MAIYSMGDSSYLKHQVTVTQASCPQLLYKLNAEQFTSISSLF